MSIQTGVICFFFFINTAVLPSQNFIATCITVNNVCVPVW